MTDADNEPEMPEMDAPLLTPAVIGRRADRAGVAAMLIVVLSAAMLTLVGAVLGYSAASHELHARPAIESWGHGVHDDSGAVRGTIRETGTLSLGNSSATDNGVTGAGSMPITICGSITIDADSEYGGRFTVLPGVENVCSFRVRFHEPHASCTVIDERQVVTSGSFSPYTWRYDDNVLVVSGITPGETYSYFCSRDATR